MFFTLATILTVVVALKVPMTARAGSFSLNTGFGYSGSETESENKVTMEKSESQFTSLSQRYNLYFSRDFYPYLIFSGGGNFRIEDTQSGIGESRAEVERTYISPFMELRLENPLIQAGIGYRDSEIRRQTSGVMGTASFSKTRYSSLSLRPDQLPQLDLRVSKTDRFDDPETIKRVSDEITVHTSYIYEGLNVDYTFTKNQDENKLTDFKTSLQSHNANIQYGRSYLDGRVNINTGYSLTQSKTDLQGIGSALVPVLRWEGLFSLDLTPEDGPALTSIGGLIDGNTVVPTSLDIGLAGDETTMTNIGVNLGVKTNVDTIHLWVDRELAPEIADSFSWFVYTSPDNTDSSAWTPHATISPGNLGVFENRFEINFPVVDTQFIKIAVMPLLPSVPGASNFNNIFVTEMEVLVTLTEQDDYSSKNQRLNYSIKWRASDDTSLGYDWFYSNQLSDPGDYETTSITNGVFVNHTFNNTFSGSARISHLGRFERTDSLQETSSINYSASLRAKYVETFQQVLTYSKSRKYGDREDSSSDSVYLRNNAALYDGIDVFLDAGINWSKGEDKSSKKSKLLKVGSKLVPNEKVTMKLDYLANWSHNSTEEEVFVEQGNFQTFIIPSHTISMFARVGYEKRHEKTEDSRKTFQFYNLSWSPSLGHSVQFFLIYNQSFESEGDKDEKRLSPGFRWRVTRYAHLQTAYNWSESDSNTNRTDSRSLTANLNLIL